MKDATLATRTERAVAHLDALLVRAEAIVGRLENLLEHVRAMPAPLDGESTPPVDPEAQKAADKYIENRLDEIEVERAQIESNRELIE